MKNKTKHCSPEVASKVAYEIRMLHHTFARICQLDLSLEGIAPGEVYPSVGTGISTDEIRDTSAWLESFLIHVRALRAFFANHRPKGKDNDVIGSDFISHWSISLEDDLPYVTKHKERLDQCLAHITTSRAKPDSDKLWDIRVIMDELKPVIARFLTELPESMRPWFADALPNEDMDDK